MESDIERLNRLRSRVDLLRGALLNAKNSKVNAVTSVSKAREESLDAEEAQRVVQLVAASVQKEVHSRIAVIVSRCLESVFDEPYEFRVIFEQKRGRTEARLVFVRDGMEYEPTKDCGGGVVDVASFALRVAVLLLQRPPLRRLLVLDEPFRFVSVNYRPRVRKLVEELSTELNIQFIIVTHDESFHMGKVVEL